MAHERVAGANQLPTQEMSVVLATDCGSTTTKAILFERTAKGWRSTFRGEAPTTVEKPLADVTIGARNAFEEVQELSGRKILKDSSDSNPDESPLLIRKDQTDNNGIDLYLSTSSAGGGLQMVVAGVVSSMTTESAERAALGAGAIVMDAISIDDGREQHERVKKIRHLRPDIMLIAGGTEGGNINHPIELAETLLQANPRPRFGETLKLPVIYAANSAAREDARTILSSAYDFVAVENIRPSLERENLAPARDAIHELFLNHVMSHAPGYRKLLNWSPVPIIPTPAGFGEMVLTAAGRDNISILAVDIGGATTDVFSVFPGTDAARTAVFNRTVSANLGMSYSVANVLLEAGVANITRWLPFNLSAEEVRDRLYNKMIRPTTIPQTMEDLILEQAVAREALRLALLHHKRLAVGLRGVQQRRTIADVFRQKVETSLVNMFELDLIIGSGGVLSHAPNRQMAALILIDAYEPLGVTRLAVDSIFMMPHLGVLSTVHAAAAAEVFMKDCLVELGTVIAPNGTAQVGEKLFEVVLTETKQTVTVNCGEIHRIPLTTGEQQTVLCRPLKRGIDFGPGIGRELKATVYGGPAGVILDGRGRPLSAASSTKENSLQQSQMGHKLFGYSW